MTQVIPISMIVLLGIVAFLIFHHAVTHEGQGVDTIDFKNSMNALFSSHEGIILFVILFASGIMVGDLIDRR